MSEVYPSGLSLRFFVTKPVLDALKLMRKPMMPRRERYLLNAWWQVCDMVIAMCLVQKGGVRVMEYNHAPVTHVNKKRCIGHASS